MNWWCTLACLLLASCRTPPVQTDLELVRRSQPLLGTFVTITAWSPDRRSANAAVSAAFDEIRRVDALMSIHRPDSELSRLNARATGEAVEVSPQLFQVIATAQAVGRETDGSFDVTIRPLADLWGFIWKEHRLPAAAELQAVLPQVNLELIELNPAERSVRFRQDDVSIDLGGIAKGFAVDCAIEKLRSLGIRNAMVKAGGDLRVIGTPPGQPFWTVQLEDPDKQGNRIAIPLRNAALSTSGDYENFFEIDGVRYSHILDPRTGLPVQGVAACTVIAPTCLESDAWATACMIYGASNSLRRFDGRFPIRFTLRETNSTTDILQVVQTPSFPEPLPASQLQPDS